MGILRERSGPHLPPRPDAMPRQRRYPAGRVGHEGQAESRADDEAGALEVVRVVFGDEGLQGEEGHGHAAEVDDVGALGDFLQPAAVLEAVDHVAVVQLVEFDGVAGFVLRRTAQRAQLLRRGGEGQAVDGDEGVEPHGLMGSGAGAATPRRSGPERRLPGWSAPASSAAVRRGRRACRRSPARTPAPLPRDRAA